MLSDGALRVAFTASGWVEMAWHLYQWGDKVEVIDPAALRDLVKDHRRGDVEVLPWGRSFGTDSSTFYAKGRKRPDRAITWHMHNS